MNGYGRCLQGEPRAFRASSILLLIILACSSQAIVAQGKGKAAILANFEKQENCWNQQDLECYCSLYSNLDSARTISRAGLTYGRKNILSDYIRNWPKDRMGNLHFDEMNIERLGSKYYFVTGRFNLTYKERDKISGYFSVIMIKEKGEWKIYTDHSS
ncbi:MAG: nuclear transport factor 2 family protein [Cyclobacteriaceae bacterium]